jgi:DNA-binding transcriptional ArsR family regulator
MAAKQNTARREREKQRPLRLEAVGEAPKLDRLVHERLRLGILSALAVNDSLTFNELKKLLDTTDGNLSVHARKLEEAGYVACAKSFEGRVPRTDYRLIAAGRRALDRYLDHMEALIQAMREK